MIVEDGMRLLMEELLHHLGCKNPVNNNGISYLSTGSGYLPSTGWAICQEAPRPNHPAFRQSHKLTGRRWCCPVTEKEMLETILLKSICSIKAENLYRTWFRQCSQYLNLYFKFSILDLPFLVRQDFPFQFHQGSVRIVASAKPPRLREAQEKRARLFRWSASVGRQALKVRWGKSVWKLGQKNLRKKHLESIGDLRIGDLFCLRYAGYLVDPEKRVLTTFTHIYLHLSSKLNYIDY